MTDRKKYLSNYMKDNYSQIRIVIRKDDPTDQEIVNFLKQKDDKSGYLKKIILAEMEREKKIERCLSLAGCRPLEELIDEIPGCYTADDVREKLDRMDTCREVNWIDWDGRNVLAGDIDDLRKIARPDIDGTAEWFGYRYCGENEAIVQITGYDWDDEEQTFLSMTDETIGWRRK